MSVPRRINGAPEPTAAMLRGRLELSGGMFGSAPGLGRGGGPFRPDGQPIGRPRHPERAAEVDDLGTVIRLAIERGLRPDIGSVIRNAVRAARQR